MMRESILRDLMIERSKRVIVFLHLRRLPRI